MEVPSVVLQKLVCERCSWYLSRGPVHVVDNTKYRCGRCTRTEDGEEEGIRVEAYEELAKLMSFPCRYRENGCTSMVLFTDNERHEQACPFRQYLCPVEEWGQCAWTGLQTEILEHCQQEHPTNVVENPRKFTCDITRSSLNNYILFVFEVLFVIQSEVCTATRKIHHAVWLIDNVARASDFKYTLDIENNGRLTSTPRDVWPRERDCLDEDISLVTDINSLLEMLGDFKDTTFTVTIESNTPDHLTPPVKTLEVRVTCGECYYETEPVYRGDWMCNEHVPTLRVCKNHTLGCTYSDISGKCTKHERYYCQYTTHCEMCRQRMTGTTLDSHYTQAHGKITHRLGTVCTVKPVLRCKWFILDCDFGRTVCMYDMYECIFSLIVLTPLPIAQLYKYRCTVELSHPVIGHILTLTRTPVALYNSMGDWAVSIRESDYDAYIHDNEINIKINITKIDDPSQFMV